MGAGVEGETNLCIMLDSSNVLSLLSVVSYFLLININQLTQNLSSRIFLLYLATIGIRQSYCEANTNGLKGKGKEPLDLTVPL